MNILIVGSGAREHILAKTCFESPTPHRLFCCGNSMNPGIKKLVADYAVVEPSDLDQVLERALLWRIDLAVIGPEAPLEKGLADRLEQHGILTVGPKQKLARLETSKAFTRDLFKRYQIPGSPKYQYFKSLAGVQKFLEELGEGNYVVKADGLMGGKGVKVAGDHLQNIDEAFLFCEQLVQSGRTFVIEEKLVGPEFSWLHFCDGERLIPMPMVQDHKRAFVGDTGPNTGGMGSYSDANHSLPFLTPTDLEAARVINQQAIQALQQECGESYRGILYGSFIATQNGIYLIEYNTRFGDPEVLNLLSIFDGDFVQVCVDMARGSLEPESVRFKSLATVCKYAVPIGYPDAPVTNQPLSIEKVQHPDQLYFGAVNDLDGLLVATGSRAVAVVGIGASIVEAEKRAEEEICRVEGELFHREDIGRLASSLSKLG